MEKQSVEFSYGNRATIARAFINWLPITMAIILVGYFYIDSDFKFDEIFIEGIFIIAIVALYRMFQLKTFNQQPDFLIQNSGLSLIHQKYFSKHIIFYSWAQIERVEWVRSGNIYNHVIQLSEKYPYANYAIYKFYNLSNNYIVIPHAVKDKTKLVSLLEQRVNK